MQKINNYSLLWLFNKFVSVPVPIKRTVCVLYKPSVTAVIIGRREFKKYSATYDTRNILVISVLTLTKNYFKKIQRPAVEISCIDYVFFFFCTETISAQNKQIKETPLSLKDAEARYQRQLEEMQKSMKKFYGKFSYSDIQISHQILDYSDNCILVHVFVLQKCLIDIALFVCLLHYVVHSMLKLIYTLYIAKNGKIWNLNKIKIFL